MARRQGQGDSQNNFGFGLVYDTWLCIQIKFLKKLENLFVVYFKDQQLWLKDPFLQIVVLQIDLLIN